MGCIGAKSKVISTNFKKDTNNTKVNIIKQREEKPQNKLIKCYSIKNNNENLLEISAEKLLQKDYVSDEKTKTGSKSINLKYNKSLQIMNNELDSENIEFIKKSLSNHYLFKDLSNKIISLIIENFVLFNIDENHTLFREGEVGNFVYLVKEGKLNLKFSDREDEVVLLKGDIFGELALIQKTKRSGTVKSLTPSEIYCMEGIFFRDIVRKINSMDMNERIYIIKQLPILKSLNIIQLNNIANEMLKCQFEDSQVIQHEGHNIDSIFIIKKGNVKMKSNGGEIKILSNNDYFGEIYMLFNIKPSVSYVCSETTVCFQITISVIIETLGDNYRDILLKGLIIEILNTNKILKNLLIEKYYDKLYSCFKLFKKKNSIIISNNHYELRKILIVIEGKILNSVSNHIIASKGEVYGDLLLKSEENLEYDIITDNETYVLEALWDEINSIFEFGIDNSKNLKFLIRLAYMKNIHIFKNLPESRLIEICKRMKKNTYDANEIIFEEGSSGDHLFIIYKGRVCAYKGDKKIREIESGNCFGEISLVFDQLRTASIRSIERTSIFILSKNDFFNLIDKNMLDYLIKKISLQDNFSTELEDLLFVKKLGQGKFGYVCLVHNTKNLFAIKAVYKKSAEKQKILSKYFLKERQILLSLDHQFIVKLVKTLKNEEFVFYLMEFVNGISMSKYIQSRLPSKLYNRYETQFYISSLLIIVDYLNSRKIVHRDIKPDNIMIDDKGYLKMIDFGTAVILKDFTNTIVGTPHYIAPEVLIGKGYNNSADYWSVGITAFELFFNYYPFGHKANDPLVIYREIIKKNLEFPDIEDKSILELISNLLKKKPHERVCCLNTFKNFIFFADFNFNDLLEFNLSPPYVSNKPTNIDKMFTSQINYLEKLNNKIFQDSILSSYEEEDNNQTYNSKWAEEF